jgi:uncharacterized protein YecT (DUF1311 family)
LEESSWIVLVCAYKTEQEAADRAGALRRDGWDAGYLWIPDYRSLSGTRMYAAFIGPAPLSKEGDAQRLLRERKKKDSGTYGLKLDTSGPRVSLSSGTKPTAPAHPRVAPSYRCSQARTETEIAICRSADLAQLDSEMADIYGSVRAGTTGAGRDRLVSEQRTWLGNREKCSRRVDMDGCIRRLYRARIGELGG